MDKDLLIAFIAIWVVFGVCLFVLNSFVGQISKKILNLYERLKDIEERIEKLEQEQKEIPLKFCSYDEYKKEFDKQKKKKGW